MAFEGNINEVFAVEEIAQQFDAVKGMVVDYTGILKKAHADVQKLGLGLQEGDAKNMNTLIAKTKELSAAQEKVKTTTVALTAVNEAKLKLSKDLEKAEARLKSLYGSEADELAKLREQIRAKNQDLRNSVKATEAAEGSLDQLRARLNLTRKSYDGLSREIRESSIGQAMKAQINAFDAEVKHLEQSTGRFQKNVGNYSTGVMQITRELPVLGQSVQTFILGISNNIGQLQDDITAMRKTGKSTQEIVKSLGTSFLSVNTALILGVTLLIKYGDQLFAAKKSAKELREETEKYTDALTKNIEKLQELKDLQKEEGDLNKDPSIRAAKARLKRMEAEGKTLYELQLQKDKIHELEKAQQLELIGSYNHLIGAVKDYSKTYIQAQRDRDNAAGVKDRGNVNVDNLQKEAEASELMRKSLKALTQEFVKTGDFSEKEARDIAKNVIKGGDEAQAMIDSLVASRLAATAELNAINDDYITDIIQTGNKTQDELEKIRKDAAKDAERYGLANTLQRMRYELSELQKQIDNTKVDTPLFERLLGKKEQLEGLISIYENGGLIKRILVPAGSPDSDIADFLTEQIRDILEKVDSNLDAISFSEFNAFNVLENAYANDEITYKEYLARKEKLANDYATKRLEAEIEGLKNIINNVDLTETERADKIEELRRAELELVEQTNKAKVKSDKAAAEESVKAEKERIAEIIRISNQVANAATSVADTIINIEQSASDRKLMRLDEELEANERNKEAAINNINATEEDEKERIKAVAEAEAEHDAKRIAIEERKKQEIVKQARLNKAAAILDISVKGAALVIKEYLTNGYAGAIAAGIAVAAQAAAAAAAPIPHYKEGAKKGEHKGGLAIVGDGGEPELIRTGNTAFWSPSTDTLMNLPAGTEVTPLSKITADSEQLMFASMANQANPIKQGEIVTELKNIQQGLKQQAKQIASGITVYNSILTQRGVEHQLKKGETTYKIRNKFL